MDGVVVDVMVGIGCCSDENGVVLRKQIIKQLYRRAWLSGDLFAYFDKLPDQVMHG